VPYKAGSFCPLATIGAIRVKVFSASDPGFRYSDLICLHFHSIAVEVLRLLGSQLLESFPRGLEIRFQSEGLLQLRDRLVRPAFFV